MTNLNAPVFHFTKLNGENQTVLINLDIVNVPTSHTVKQILAQ